MNVVERIVPRTWATLLMLCLIGAGTSAGATGTRIPASISQGGLLIGHVPPHTQVRYAGNALHVGADGVFVLGVGRRRVRNTNPKP